jgi:hypothetical protein
VHRRPPIVESSTTICVAAETEFFHPAALAHNQDHAFSQRFGADRPSRSKRTIKALEFDTSALVFLDLPNGDFPSEGSPVGHPAIGASAAKKTPVRTPPSWANCHV